MTNKVYSQFIITGKVEQTDKNKNQFTEVLLIDKDSIIVKNGLIEENGNFTLKINDTGVYTFKVKQFNHFLYNRNIQINSDFNLGTIVIENTKKIEEVIITSKKKLIERKIDRVVFNVENAIATAGGDALEALKITPGVKVRNDNISIIGKGAVSVMVDDRLIELKQEDLSNFLKSIAADNIKSIEVISTPPAKYDAVGNSGIINIKTKIAKRDSWNANAGMTYLQRSRSEGSGFANFNFNKGRWAISSALSYRQGGLKIDADDYAYFQDALWYTKSPQFVRSKRFSSKFGVDYTINNFWKTGIQYIANINRSKLPGQTSTDVLDYGSDTVLQQLQSNGNQNRKPNFNSINYYNEFKLDSLNRKIILNFDYFNYANQDDRYYEGNSATTTPYQQQFYNGFSLNSQNINNYSGKIDVEYPLKNINISFGGKIGTSKAKNDMDIFNSGLSDTPVISFPSNSTRFEYTEHIQALYASANKKFGDHWETQLGMRLEAMQTKSNSISLNQTNNYNYAKLFPSLFINYKSSENSSFALNYSRRIERPSFHELNPNQWYINPFQKLGGNPFLRPAFIDNIDLSYTYKALESKIYFSNEKNLFGQIALADPVTNEISFTNENYVNTKRWGISESYTFDKLKWWTSMNSLDISYVKAESFIPAIQRYQKGWSGRFSTNNDFILNKDKTFLFNVNYWYSPRSVDGKFYNIGAMGNLSASLQYVLMNKNLRISLKVNDILRTEKVRQSSTVNNVYQEGIYYMDNQYVQLSMSYKFGNQKIKSVKRATGNEEEINRTGN
ncbi:TonB-dependent receptor domain-containing protein [Chryseobacterium piperi]|uniref:TonB-dependent receptor domain-containing protein n=1 Tax=Chryseobacterium piperi TaxID=558152 RepID=UPI000A4E8C8C|nr:TonB-dependent receptor [Chryseobacterium piperi]